MATDHDGGRRDHADDRPDDRPGDRDPRRAGRGDRAPDGAGSNGRVAVETRLQQVLSAADDFQPAPDLWERVEASLVEDAERRGRRRRLVLAVVAVAIALAAAALRGGVLGGAVFEWRLFELVESLVMIAIVVGIRPLLDDAGRDFLRAVFRGSESAAVNLVSLLDVAWNLVFLGMVVMTVAWEPSVPVFSSAAHQVDQAFDRISALLFTMGVLHGITFMAMPVVGLAWMAARTGQRLPRWVMALLAVGGVVAALFLVNAMIAMVVGPGG
ncbi:MAG TPA: hypothetical protein VJ978_07055, partial [Nitriliruptoraceae bacterium]|nr:hypothetical protein [Nitriliruptoraceae bacterium]